MFIVWMHFHHKVASNCISRGNSYFRLASLSLCNIEVLTEKMGDPVNYNREELMEDVGYLIP